MKVQFSLLTIRLIFTIFFVLSAAIANSQILIDDSCPSPNGGRRAHFRVELFLTDPDRADKRVETGAANETVAMIRPVSVDSICSKLTEITMGNVRYRQVDESLDDKETKYYYRTDNLYYIFWTKKPAYDNIPSMGPRTLFIVISKDYRHIWEYYF